MGPCKTSNFSNFTFIYASDLKFCTRSYSSCVYRTMRFKGSNGKVCKMMTSHFRTLYPGNKSFCRSRTSLDSTRENVCVPGQCAKYQNLEASTFGRYCMEDEQVLPPKPYGIIYIINVIL